MSLYPSRQQQVEEGLQRVQDKLEALIEEVEKKLEEKKPKEKTWQPETPDRWTDDMVAFGGPPDLRICSNCKEVYPDFTVSSQMKCWNCRCDAKTKKLIRQNWLLGKSTVYFRHFDSCSWNNTMSCTCGLGDLLDNIKEEEKLV
jgi:hypothetical protein